MHKTPASGRLHIGIFGKRNTGKSSLTNALAGQELSIVSDISGTTTDPVYKSIEILPVGPCIIVDTAGIDDIGALGEERIKQTRKVIRKTDIGIIVVEPGAQIDHFEEELANIFITNKLPYIFVVNKIDLDVQSDIKISLKNHPFVEVSAKTNFGIEELKNKIIELAPATWSPIPLVKDIINEGDRIVLVCPIDSAMPQGRLILPQVQVLREILDSNAVGYVTKETELNIVLGSLKAAPDLVITDSQVFEDVSQIVPKNVPLTSFSTIFARHRGDINEFISGAKTIDTLLDGDEILIAEACTHHPQPEDIARTKIPTWLQGHTGKDLHYDIVAGGDFPTDLGKYKLIITCGGCMINRRESLFRINKAKSQNVPITNYGILIAYLNNILERVTMPFKKGAVQINIEDKIPV